MDIPGKTWAGAGAPTCDGQGEVAATNLRAGRIASRNAAIDYVRLLGPDYEGSLLALYLDGNFNVLAADRLGEGSVARCAPKAMLLMKRGLELAAGSFLLIHHGRARTSKASLDDVRITKEIRMAGEDLEIHLLEHLVLSGGEMIQAI